MTGSTVRGSVKVLQGGRLYAIENNIKGNVDGEKSLYVWLDRNTVNGSISVKEGGPDPLPVWFCANMVAGNIHVEKTTADFGIIIGFGSGCPGAGGGNTVGGNLTAYENVIGPSIGGFNITINTVRGNLQVYKTRGPGPKHVNANFVHENLQCFDNEAPFDGAGNTAEQAQGQCTAVALPPFVGPVF
jgi:hypothetical protein